MSGAPCSFCPPPAPAPQVVRPTAASAPGRLCFRPTRQRALRPPLPPPRLLEQQRQACCASGEQALRCQCPEPAPLTRRHWYPALRALGLVPPPRARSAVAAAAAVRLRGRPWGGRGCLPVAGREETQCPSQTASVARDGRTGPVQGMRSSLGASASYWLTLHTSKRRASGSVAHDRAVRARLRSM